MWRMLHTVKEICKQNGVIGKVEKPLQVLYKLHKPKKERLKGGKNERIKRIEKGN